MFWVTRTSWYLFLVSKECKRPEDPKNGEKFGSDFSVGKRVRYTCDTGFVLQGASEIKCLNNRTWSGGAPSCKGKHKIHDSAQTCTHTHTLYFSNSLIIHHISKHLEVSQKYFPTCRIFKSILGFWKCGKTWSFLFDILHIGSFQQHVCK